MKLIQIISAEKGKCCDLNPPFSLHTDKNKIMPFCETREIESKYVSTKTCPCGCGIKYAYNTPFVKSGQIDGGSDISIRCYERKHHLTSDSYREALRAEYELELKMKQYPNH